MFRRIFRPAPLALLALGVLHTAGCASSASRPRAQQLEVVAKLGLSEVEGWRGPLVLAAGPEVAPEVVAAFSTFRSVISRTQVPETDTDILPEGYLVLQQLFLNGTEATFVGITGPWLRHHSLDCGVTYHISMHLGADGTWRVDGRSITVC